jgi:hypothetical protein
MREFGCAGAALSGAFTSPSANGLLPATMTGQVFDFSPFAVDFSATAFLSRQTC